MGVKLSILYVPVFSSFQYCVFRGGNQNRVFPGKEFGGKKTNVAAEKSCTGVAVGPLRDAEILTVTPSPSWTGPPMLEPEMANVMSAD